MKRSHKILIGVGVGLVASSLLGWKLITRAKARKVIEGAYSTVKTTVTGEFPLAFGSRGENVKKLQEYLNSKIQPPLAYLDVDGIFGVLTQGALKSVTGKTSMTKEEFSKIA